MQRGRAPSESRRRLCLLSHYNLRLSSARLLQCGRVLAIAFGAFVAKPTIGDGETGDGGCMADKIGERGPIHVVIPYAQCGAVVAQES